MSDLDREIGEAFDRVDKSPITQAIRDRAATRREESARREAAAAALLAACQSVMAGMRLSNEAGYREITLESAQEVCEAIALATQEGA